MSAARITAESYNGSDMIDVYFLLTGSSGLWAVFLQTVTEEPKFLLSWCTSFHLPHMTVLVCACLPEVTVDLLAGSCHVPKPRHGVHYFCPHCPGQHSDP